MVRQWSAAIAIIGVVFAIASACSSSSERDSTNLDQIDPSQYYVTLTGLEITQPQWVLLVEKWREGGLGGLSDEERKQVVDEAQWAYLTQVKDVELDITVGNGQGRRQSAHVIDTFADGRLTGRQVTSDGVPAAHGGIPFLDPSAPVETRLVREPSSNGAIHGWTKIEGAWRCQLYNSSATGADELDYIGLVTLAARGEIGAQRSIRGRTTISLVVPGANGLPDLTYWLDKSTLWPVEIGVRATADIPASYTTLVKVNGGVTVADPGNATTCAPVSAG